MTIKNFPKEYKYTLGELMQKEMIMLITHIYKANGTTFNRSEHIVVAKEKLEGIRLYLRISKDMKLIPLNTYVEFSVSLEDISKQLTARSRKSREISH